MLSGLKKQINKIGGAIGDIGTALYKEPTRLVRNIANETQNIFQDTVGNVGEALGHETYNAVHKAGHEISNAWTGGLRDAAIYGGLTAGLLVSGGAIAGALGAGGLASAGAGVSSVLGSATGLTAIASSAVTGGSAQYTEKKTAEANAVYQRQVAKANAEALEERKASLLKTKKALTPNLTRASQGGFGGSNEELSVKLG